MKNILIVAISLITSSALANSLKLNIDEVDTISSNGKSVLVEDLRDGFDSINDVQVSEDTVSIKSNSNVKILFKSGLEVNSRAMAVKAGGDMGGG
jgi:hypothetical protein